MEKTKRVLIFDKLPQGTQTYWYKNGTGFEEIFPGQRIEDVDLALSPELRHQIEIGHARWED